MCFLGLHKDLILQCFVRTRILILGCGVGCGNRRFRVWGLGSGFRVGVRGFRGLGVRDWLDLQVSCLAEAQPIQPPAKRFRAPLKLPEILTTLTLKHKILNPIP